VQFAAFSGNTERHGMTRWGMVIDLRKCIGCGTCKEVCVQDKDKAPVERRRVIENQVLFEGHSDRLSVTMSCMHCETPPCKDVCPSGATFRRPDGIIDIQEDLCVGCGACIVACPYHSRSICSEDVMFGQQSDNSPEEKEQRLDRIGICVKCDACSRIVQNGLKQNIKPGIDPEATPLCVRFCIGEALYFGDLDDPESNVSMLIRENNTFRLLENHGTQPGTYYIIN
jgi:phenylacetyl-CoA:acceptor oxidoreductase subunit 1